MASTDAPPPYVPTIYDETLRSIFYIQPSIMSMANNPTLLGQLEYHSPTTDGSFSICIAGGEGVFISQALLESIPAEHRSVLDTGIKDQTIETLVARPMKSIGTTFIPVILTEAQTGKKIRIVLYAIVVPNLFMGMFIGSSAKFIESEVWGNEGPTYTFNFGQGGVRKIKGIGL